MTPEELENRLWQLENPPKYQKGFHYRDEYGHLLRIEDVDFIETKNIPYYNYSVYYYKQNRIIYVSEGCIIDYNPRLNIFQKLIKFISPR